MSKRLAKDAEGKDYGELTKEIEKNMQSMDLDDGMGLEKYDQEDSNLSIPIK